jgi:hypothetical protein
MSASVLPLKTNCFGMFYNFFTAKKLDGSSDLSENLMLFLNLLQIGCFIMIEHILSRLKRLFNKIVKHANNYDSFLFVA